jgi:murein L,D-transpeptidase YcbB/YkuD
VYRSQLVTAVKKFQRRHGLAPTGRIDRATLTQLNTPLAFRVHQLELALERWRRRPYDPSRPAIVLNLPEFRLRAFGAGNQLELEMKIVVGQAPDRQTPLLSSQVQTVIFRPYWNVPISIQRDELVPQIVKDPSYLAANHLQVVTPQGEVVEHAMSEDTMAQLSSGTLGLRQTPGPANVLGLVKFLFPNAYGVYMHGTSAPGLFARSRRDFSHGCVRVERAEELAEWALRNEAGWSRDRIRKAMRGSESITVNLKEPVQVVTMYVTALVLESGEVHFFDDIYGEDTVLEKELAGGTPPASPGSITSGLQ